MDSKSDMYFNRAKTEFETSEILFDISKSKDKKQNFNISQDSTYYSGVISHSYYAIFYSAKAMLLTKNIETEAPEVHKKTLEAFEKYLVSTGKLDMELLKIYQKMIVRADALLGIFSMEKRKRGEFTYQKLPQANKEPAQESLNHASFFFKNMNKIL